MASLAKILSNTNAFLEQVPKNVNSYFNNLFKSGEEVAQEEVDIACRYMACKVNRTVERVRRNVIKALHGHYSGVLGLIGQVNIMVQAVRDPMRTAGKVFSMLSKPYGFLTGFVQVLIIEIPKLAGNLANIARSLPPQPPTPRINMDAFRLRIKSISLSDIVAGVDGLPPVEKEFPLPSSTPFDKQAFDAAFNREPEEEKVAFPEPTKTAVDLGLRGKAEITVDDIIQAVPPDLGLRKGEPLTEAEIDEILEKRAREKQQEQ